MPPHRSRGSDVSLHRALRKLYFPLTLLEFVSLSPANVRNYEQYNHLTLLLKLKSDYPSYPTSEK